MMDNFASFGNDRVFIKTSSSEIELDLQDRDHTYNQTTLPLDYYQRQKIALTLFEVLLDGQSTCDVIVNKAFLLNIRKSKWTLVLHTQAGAC